MAQLTYTRALPIKASYDLIVSGRCISTDRKVQGSIRVMPCRFFTGMAAAAHQTLRPWRLCAFALREED